MERSGKIPFDFVGHRGAECVISTAASRCDGLQLVIDRFIRKRRWRINRRRRAVPADRQILLVPHAPQIAAEGTVKRDTVEDVVGRHGHASVLLNRILELFRRAALTDRVVLVQRRQPSRQQVLHRPLQSDARISCARNHGAPLHRHLLRDLILQLTRIRTQIAEELIVAARALVRAAADRLYIVALLRLARLAGRAVGTRRRQDSSRCRYRLALCQDGARFRYRLYLHRESLFFSRCLLPL